MSVRLGRALMVVGMLGVFVSVLCVLCFPLLLVSVGVRFVVVELVFVVFLRARDQVHTHTYTHTHPGRHRRGHGDNGQQHYGRTSELFVNLTFTKSKCTGSWCDLVDVVCCFDRGICAVSSFGLFSLVNL